MNTWKIGKKPPNTKLTSKPWNFRNFLCLYLLCLALILQAPPLTFLVKSSDTAEAFPTQQRAENRKCNCREKIQLQTMPSKLPHAAGTGCRTREGSKEKGRLAQRIQKLIKRLVFQRAQSKLLGARTNPKKTIPSCFTHHTDCKAQVAFKDKTNTL